MKKLNIEQIKKGILVGKPVQVTVQIKLDGGDAEFETHIKPFSYETAVANLRAFGEQKEALAGILASCICDEKGTQAFTEAEIRQHFNQSLVDALWAKVIEINVLGKTSNSAQKTNSSAKSQSPQGVALKKQNNSQTKKSKLGQPTEPNEAHSTQVEELNKPSEI